MKIQTHFAEVSTLAKRHLTLAFGLHNQIQIQVQIQIECILEFQ